MDTSHALNAATDIAHEAGRLLMDAFGGGSVAGRKSSAIDLVTEADEQAERLITQRIRDAFPDHRLLAEEGGGQNEAGGERIWYIDPLDGTNNFAHGYPIFCVSLALYEGETPLLGVVHDPPRNETFSAVRDEGAHVQTGAGKPQPLRVSEAGDLVEGLIATGFPYDRHTSSFDNLAQFGAVLKRAQGVRRAGSAALDLCQVAAGRLDGFWEYKLRAWDVAAGRLFVEEAGGKVTAPDGSPLHLPHEEPMHILATNGRLHEAVSQALRSVG